MMETCDNLHKAPKALEAAFEHAFTVSLYVGDFGRFDFVAFSNCVFGAMQMKELPAEIRESNGIMDGDEDL